MPTKKYPPDPYVNALREAFVARGIDIGETQGQLPGKIYHLLEVNGLKVEFGHHAVGERVTAKSSRHTFIKIQSGDETIITLDHNGGAVLSIELELSQYDRFQHLRGNWYNPDPTYWFYNNMARISVWIDAVNATIDAIVANHGPTPSRT